MQKYYVIVIMAILLIIIVGLEHESIESNEPRDGSLRKSSLVCNFTLLVPYLQYESVIMRAFFLHVLD